MNFLKKAKTQVKGAVQDAQGMYGQYKQQQQQQQPGYQQPQQGSHPQAPQGGYQTTQGYQQPHQAPPPTQGYQQPPQGYQQSQPGYAPQAGHHQPTQGHQQPTHQGPQSPQQGYPPSQGYQQPPQGYQQPNNNHGQPAYSPGGYQNAQHGGHPQQQGVGYQQTPTPPAPPPQHTPQHAPQQSYQPHSSQSPTHHTAPALPPPLPNQPYNMNSLYQALPDATHQPHAPSASPYSQPPAHQHQSPPANEVPPPVNHASRPDLPSGVSSPPQQPPLAPQPPATNVVRGGEVSQHPNSGSLAPSHASPPPVSLTAAAQICPGREFVSVDLIPFYVFQPHVLAQVQPALDADNFGMCSACFLAHVAPYPNIASNFQLRKIAEKGPDAPPFSFDRIYCDFTYPTARQIFYQQCVPRGTVMPLLQYTKFTVDLPACEGAVIDQPAEYYESNRGDGFACCKTCYESFIRSTAFERDMVVQRPGEGWYCDIGARGYLFRMLIAELEGQRPDFNRFSSKSKQRNSLPPCSGKGNRIVPENSSGPHFSFQAPGDKSGIICPACYWDKILGTSMEPFFNAYTQIEEQDYASLACDIAGLPETFAMEAAIRAGDDEAWRRCVSGRSTLPKCVSIEGVEETTLQGQDESSRWYCFTEHPSIEVCPLCYCATVEILGAGPLFSPITRPLRPGVVRMCYLAETKTPGADLGDAVNFEDTLVWRGGILRAWLHQGYHCRGNFDGLKYAAKEIASWPPPCNSGVRPWKPINGRKWYGNKFYALGDDHQTGIRICEECFTHYVKDTPLESYVGEDLTEQVYESLPDGCVCNAQTRRARDELSSACQKGDFMQFSRYWAARKDCRARFEAMDARCQQQADRQQVALNALNMQNQMASIKLMQGLTANTNATIMGIGGSVAEAASPDYGQRYGNAAVGHGYLTAAGANAAQARIDAAAKMSQGISVADFRSTGDTWQDTQQLLALAKALKAEWDAIR
ncbi:hypothetical protein G7Z17_g2219 [Cylindrodendrum hubeiense]|uniref:Integral membrane protein n=1 Tax=Cylindrodendrum hubeiense TaxID=595255 RepID=A0A9P5HK48_9HYPO|nr:hypothetical protein G7Z17_g2219 [Cylindrodendrum hubeiense]